MTKPGTAVLEKSFFAYVIRALVQGAALRTGSSVTLSGDHMTSASGLFARISYTEMLHLVGRCLLFPTKAELLWEH